MGAGSASVDELGRLPFRVLSINKYAFPKNMAYAGGMDLGD
jgi:hypothetical protein